jgi:tetratricopeptide (TPR) repeat protein
MVRQEDVMEKEFNKIITGCLVLTCVFLLLLGAISFAGYLGYKPIMAQYYYDQGVDAKIKGHVIESKDYLNKAMEIAPDSKTAEKAELYLKTRLPVSDNISPEAIALNIKGYNYNSSGDYEKALEFHQKAIDESPEFEWPYSNIASIYAYKYKDYTRAKEYLEKALSLNPDYYNARWLKGIIYWKEGHEYKEEENYSKALEMLEKSLAELEATKQIDPSESQIDEDIMDVKEYISWLKKKTKTQPTIAQ